MGIEVGGAVVEVVVDDGVVFGREENVHFAGKVAGCLRDVGGGDEEEDVAIGVEELDEVLGGEVRPVGFGGWGEEDGVVVETLASLEEGEGCGFGGFEDEGVALLCR